MSNEVTPVSGTENKFFFDELASEWTTPSLRPESSSACEVFLVGTEGASKIFERSLSAPSGLRDMVILFLSSHAKSTWEWLGNSTEITNLAEFAPFLVKTGCRLADEPSEQSGSDTSLRYGPIDDVSEVIETLFRTGKNEIFEDGMESAFSRELVAMIKRHGKAAMLDIARLVTGEIADPEVISEALKWLGRIKDPSSYSFRLWILKRGLSCSSPQVRDGAALGLAFLNDPDAVPALQRAIDIERIPELRQDLEQVLAQLKNAA